jgi:ABC-type transport system substrate-binding protein
VAGALLAGSCSPQVTPSPSATAAAPTPTPAPAYADTLRVGYWNPGLLDGTTNTPYSYVYRGLVQKSIPPSLTFVNVVYDGLYRYDAHFGTVPDLADGPCVRQADPTVLRCRIIETTFHDGTPLTADDVAYTFQLLSQETLGQGGAATGSSFREARVVDLRTVDFVLSIPDPTFLSVVLPTIPIFPRHAVEATYADFVARAKDLTSADLTKLAATIDEETGRDPPVCTTRLDEVDALFTRLGARLYHEDFPQENGAFDACWYMSFASAEISLAAAALADSGIQAVAQALMVLEPFRPPPGTGPYRLVAESADRVDLEAWPDHHGGPPATERVSFVPAGAESDLETGALHVLQYGYPSSQVSAAVRVASPVMMQYNALYLNVRPGRLFADQALRQALQLCIDLPRDVDASSGGGATAIYSPVLPGSWADDPALPRPSRDTAAAKRLIETAGWQVGANGIYAQGGVRLKAEILTRADVWYRTKMADLIAQQARDCGMDLQTLPLEFEDLLAMVNQYPHDIPRTDRPFDLYLGGMSTSVDPGDNLALFASTMVSDAAHPDGQNFVGFSDPAFDQLLDAGRATYDQAARARIYRQAQEELASQKPVIFLFAWRNDDDVAAAVATVDGPLDLEPPNWAWRPERLVVAEGVQ